MKGDFTRFTFDPSRHFSRVLMQQGRVQLDADWNEQAAILLHLQRAAIVDIIGPYAGPANRLGFVIFDKDAEGNQFEGDFLIQSINTTKAVDYLVGEGRYYVDGILCEMGSSMRFTTQPDAPGSAMPKNAQGAYLVGKYLVYLDVWERHLTYLQDNLDHLREVALLGADTAARAQVVAQVKVATAAGGWDGFTNNLSKARGSLRARCKQESSLPSDPCLAPPDSRYRGPENQLYRVEIHQGGEAGKGATFKWSRDNGSVIYPILSMDDNQVTLVNGRDDRTCLHRNDLVEVIDDIHELQGLPGALVEVTEISPGENPGEVQATIKPFQVLDPSLDSYDKNDRTSKHPVLRRWDHRPSKDSNDGAILIKEIVEGSDDDWQDLEYGIKVQFVKPEDGVVSQYRTGDYWLIPARTEIGDILWPDDLADPSKPKPAVLSPLGIEHHFAPLREIDIDITGNVTVSPASLQKRIKPDAIVENL